MSGLVDFAGYARAYARLTTVRSALLDGAPLEDALHRAVSKDDEAALDHRTHAEPLPLERALAAGCGYDRELEEAYGTTPPS
jgi:hypothetical protein